MSNRCSNITLLHIGPAGHLWNISRLCIPALRSVIASLDGVAVNGDADLPRMLRHLTGGTKLPSDQNELKVDSVNIMNSEPPAANFFLRNSE